MASGPGLPNTGSPVQLIYVVIGAFALAVGTVLTKIGLNKNDKHDGVGTYSVD